MAKNEIDFTFMDINSKNDLGLVVRDIVREITPTVSTNNIEIPGRMGNVFEGNSFGSRKFQIEVRMLEDNESKKIQRYHEIANLFMSGANDEWELKFSDEDEVYYFAHFAGITEPQRIQEGQPYVDFSIELECSDPLGALTSIETKLDKTSFAFQMEGNAPSRPIFTCIPKKAINTLAIVDAEDEDRYLLVSNGVDTDTQDVEVDKEQLILDDAMNTHDTWTKVTNQTITWDLENTARVADNVGFRTTTHSITNEIKDKVPYFGTHVPKTWYGPASQRSLPKTVNNWKVRYRVQFNNNYERAKSRIELYLLDSLGRRIGLIGIKDNDYSKKAQMYVILGKGSDRKTLYRELGTVYDKGKNKVVTKTIKIGKKKVTTKNKKGKKVTKQEPITKKLSLSSDPDTSTFSTFYGWVQIEKVDNKIVLTICKTDDQLKPKWTKKIKYTAPTKIKEALDNLSMFGIYSAKYGITEDDNKISYKNAQMYHCDLKVWEIKGEGNIKDEAPIAMPGQEVVADFENRTVSVDGVDITKKVYIDSNFFSLNGGEEYGLTVSPSIENSEWWFYRTPKVH